jgi:hypothetical protein
MILVIVMQSLYAERRVAWLVRMAARLSNFPQERRKQRGADCALGVLLLDQLVDMLDCGVDIGHDVFCCGRLGLIAD